ncbi:hypothetical protein [Microbacterium karelineae]|uniref:hypothetical protein n=1 Tax=Microbacterium karelineae TaxID=2654283 RepID=UPI0012EAAA1A|nr:hypothetical protein [Microbacterium karelineae]
MTTPAAPNPYDSAYGRAVAGAPRGSEQAGLALAALILAAIAALGSLVGSLVVLAIMASSGASFGAAGAFGGATAILFGLVAVAALILGILAARGSRPVMAGIAIGIAAAHLLSALYGILAPLLSAVLYR